jgi:hypothetical protein
MNDVRYVHFTERIQNMLIRPEILRLMKDGGLAPPDEDSRESALERAKRARGNMRGTKTFAPQQVVQLETAPKKPKKVDVKK